MAIKHQRSSTVPIDSVRPHPTMQNVRKEIDTETDEMKSLIASIRDMGLIQPLLVVDLSPAGGPLDSGLIAGFRRFAALQEIHKADPLKFATVPVAYFEGSIQEASIANLAENLQRADVNPMAVADRVNELSQEISRDAIADKLGFSEIWVNDMIRLSTGASDSTRELLEKGLISLQAAKALARVKQSKKQDKAAQVTAMAGGRGKDAKAAIVGLTAPGKKEIKDAYDDALEHLKGASKGTPEFSRTRGIIEALGWVLGSSKKVVLK